MLLHEHWPGGLDLCCFLRRGQLRENVIHDAGGPQDILVGDRHWPGLANRAIERPNEELLAVFLMEIARGKLLHVAQGVADILLSVAPRRQKLFQKDLAMRPSYHDHSLLVLIDD